MTINPDNALIRFNRQRNGARRRGIAWEFTLDQWIEVWERSGRWDSRGVGHGRFVMARHGDSGPYAAGNVSIIEAAQNTADAHRNGCFEYRAPQRPGDLMFENPPTAAPRETVEGCATYREAVRCCWANRRIVNLTNRSLASLLDIHSQHVSDWFAEDDKPSRRTLPAQLIADFEWVTGNTLVSQWVAGQSKLTVLEEMQATRAAA